MDIKKRLELIKRNTEEIVTLEELLILLKKKKKPVVYLGTAITGRPHIAYFLWIHKLADFLKAGFKVKLLLADLHGALDNTPWDVLEARYNYYKKLMPLMFKTVGADVKNFEIVKGSDFQLKKEYVLDVLKMSTFTTVRDCNKAASEVVKFGDNPKLSGLIYPIMQSLDEVYLKVDVQYGGLDQRKILMFARENLPKIGYERKSEIKTPNIPGLVEGGKKSSSVEGSKIDVLDDEKTVNEKIKRAYCKEGEIDGNGVLAFLKNVIMVINEDNNEKLVIERDEKFGGDLDFKNCLAKEVNKLLTTVRKNKKELEILSKKAY